MTNTILSQYDEDKCWSLYLSCLANPFSEQQSQTFKEFMNSFESKNEPVKTGTPRKIGLTKSEVLKQVDEANKILDGFTPPEKKGV